MNLHRRTSVKSSWTAAEKRAVGAFIKLKWPDVLAGRLLMPDLAIQLGAHIGKEPPHATTVGGWAQILGLDSPRGAMTEKRSVNAEQRKGNSVPLFSDMGEAKILAKLDDIHGALTRLSGLLCPASIEGQQQGT